MLSFFPAADPATRTRLEADPVVALASGLDWSTTELGPAAAWPEELRAAARLVLTSTLPMALLIGPRGVLLYNGAYARIVGARPSAMGQSVLQAWPETAEFNTDVIRQVIASGEPRSFNGIPFVIGGNDLAELVRFDLTYTPVLDEAGRPLAALAIAHETASKENRERPDLEVVAQELSHRIKNIFAVMSGIVSLAARSHPEAAGFAEELRGRIIALGRAHDFVRPHSRASMPHRNPNSLTAMIEELMSPHQLASENRIAIRGDDVTIDEAAATPLALIFHELATNAAKFGALANAYGRLEIDIARKDDNCRVTWRELGGPPAPLSEEQGFGSRLITLSVEGQLRGKLQRRWEADGLVAELELPVASLNRKATLQT
jgi:two-component sensor histidine kinase